MASHLGLRSLTMSHLWDPRLKWVNLASNNMIQVYAGFSYLFNLVHDFSSFWRDRVRIIMELKWNSLKKKKKKKKQKKIKILVLIVKVLQLMAHGVNLQSPGVLEKVL